MFELSSNKTHDAHSLWMWNSCSSLWQIHTIFPRLSVSYCCGVLSVCAVTAVTVADVRLLIYSYAFSWFKDLFSESMNKTTNDHKWASQLQIGIWFYRYFHLIRKWARAHERTSARSFVHISISARSVFLFIVLLDCVSLSLSLTQSLSLYLCVSLQNIASFYDSLRTIWAIITEIPTILLLSLFPIILINTRLNASSQFVSGIIHNSVAHDSITKAELWNTEKRRRSKK